MKTSKYLLISFILIALISFSCVDAPEYEKRINDSHNLMLSGIYHAIILPFSVIGKVLDINIGIYNSNKNHFTYWVGFLIGLILWGKTMFIIGKASKE